jgi:hypothetical protein
MNYKEADEEIARLLVYKKRIEEAIEATRKFASYKYNKNVRDVQILATDVVGTVCPTANKRNRLGSRVDLSDPHLTIKSRPYYKTLVEQQFSTIDTYQGKQRIWVLIPGVCSSCYEHFWVATYNPGDKYHSKCGCKCEVCVDEKKKAKSPKKQESCYRQCGECGETFQPKRSDAKFCSSKCRVAHHRNGKGKSPTGDSQEAVPGND